ncbi:VanZ family protein [Patulibacter sp. SYSU D01012]|uniref:VanZ family protein n=1 Tax=Patulibacter sp. SYSU D01012 TaxID=2817381 RepID=UPI001B307262
MITDFLLAHRWLMPAVLAAFVVVGPFAAPALASRPRIAWALALLSLLPLAALTLVPVDRELFSRCEVGWSLPTPARVELFANLVLFVAPAYLAAVASRRPLAALAAACVLSAGIEMLQALVPAIGRSCDTSDWLGNALGAVVGVGLAAVALRRHRRRGTREPLPA